MRFFRMRFFSVALAAALVLGTVVGESNAQYYATRSYVTPYVVNPYVANPYVVSPYAVNPYLSPYLATPAPIYGSGTYVSPYSYATTNYGLYPTPWGYNTVYNYGTYVRPAIRAPFHSVYWDPSANTYRYGPGYLNTPSYSFYYRY